MAIYQRRKGGYLGVKESETRGHCSPSLAVFSATDEDTGRKGINGNWKEEV